MAPPADIPAIPGALAAPAPAAPAPSSLTAGQGGAAGTRALNLDVADIRPLDVSGALQILIAEVRAALDEALLAALHAPAAAPAEPAFPAPGAAALFAAPAAPPSFAGESPQQAAQLVLETLLKALPAGAADPGQLAQALERLDSAMQSGTQRALEIVTGWQGVPLAAGEAAHAAAQLIGNGWSEEVLNSAWLRPEWALFLPRLERHRRRRRALRRWLADPDYDFQEGAAPDDERR